MKAPILMQQPTVDSLSKLFSLYRYYIWSTLLKSAFHSGLSEVCLSTDPGKALTGYVGYAKLGLGSIFMSYWYAAIYVVVEGWQELGYADPAIESLLSTDHLLRLRRHRNATCHYQPPVLSPKWLEFEQADGAVDWIYSLDKALSEWFLARTVENVERFTQCLRMGQKARAEGKEVAWHSMYDEFLNAVDRAENPGEVALRYMMEGFFDT